MSVVPDSPVNGVRQHGPRAVFIDTRFLRLRRPVALGDRIEGWRVCWLGGWDRGRVFFVVMMEANPRPTQQNCLAYRLKQSDESSCAEPAQRGLLTMTNAETTTTAAEKTAPVAESGAAEVPKKTAPKTAARQNQRAAKRTKASQGKAKPPVSKKAKAHKADRAKVVPTVRPASKGAVVLDLIRRPNGATLADLRKATGWPAHSVRGFISGVLGKKMGLQIASARRDSGERAYSLSH